MKTNKPVLLASIKNVGKMLTPRNAAFPGWSVFGNKRYHQRHAGKRDNSTLFPHRAGNNYGVITKSANWWTGQARLSSASCYPRPLPQTWSSSAGTQALKPLRKDSLARLSLETLPEVTAGHLGGYRSGRPPKSSMLLWNT